MTLIDRVGGDLPRGPVTIELDDIQATVLRYRPEPYYGTHVVLHVDEARAGREFLRRLTPHVASAADWWQAGEPWIAVAITYSGLVTLGLAKATFSIIIFVLTTGWAASEGPSLVVGLWVGFVLAWGAFRFFGWDRAFAKYVCLWGLSAECLCWSRCLS